MSHHSDLLILCAPHSVYGEADLKGKPVVDIWGFLKTQMSCSRRRIAHGCSRASARIAVAPTATTASTASHRGMARNGAFAGPMASADADGIGDVRRPSASSNAPAVANRRADEYAVACSTVRESFGENARARQTPPVAAFVQLGGERVTANQMNHEVEQQQDQSE